MYQIWLFHKAFDECCLVVLCFMKQPNKLPFAVLLLFLGKLYNVIRFHYLNTSFENQPLKKICYRLTSYNRSRFVYFIRVPGTPHPRLFSQKTNTLSHYINTHITQSKPARLKHLSLVDYRLLYYKLYRTINNTIIAQLRKNESLPDIISPPGDLSNPEKKRRFSKLI